MFRSYSDHLQGAHMFLVNVADCSPAHIFTQKARTHTKCYATASTFTFLKNFKISNINKEHMSSLKMI